jgi:hypothetical protein
MPRPVIGINGMVRIGEGEPRRIDWKGEAWPRGVEEVIDSVVELIPCSRVSEKIHFEGRIIDPEGVMYWIIVQSKKDKLEELVVTGGTVGTIEDKETEGVVKRNDEEGLKDMRVVVDEALWEVAKDIFVISGIDGAVSAV